MSTTRSILEEFMSLQQPDDSYKLDDHLDPYDYPDPRKYFDPKETYEDDVFSGTGFYIDDYYDYDEDK
jgi:hypothetical protein